MWISHNAPGSRSRGRIGTCMYIYKYNEHGSFSLARSLFLPTNYESFLLLLKLLINRSAIGGRPGLVKHRRSVCLARLSLVSPRPESRSNRHRYPLCSFLPLPLLLRFSRCFSRLYFNGRSTHLLNFDLTLRLLASHVLRAFVFTEYVLTANVNYFVHELTLVCRLL